MQEKNVLLSLLSKIERNAFLEEAEWEGICVDSAGDVRALPRPQQ